MNISINNNTAKYFFYKAINPLVYKPSENREKNSSFFHSLPICAQKKLTTAAV